MSKDFPTFFVSFFLTEASIHLRYVQSNEACAFMFGDFFCPTKLIHECSNFSDYLFKLLLIGDSGVGKSCLLLRFAVRFYVFEC